MNKLLKNLLLFSLTVVGLVSCSMMETDRSECPDGLYVRFVYDYNVQRADMFKDHTGGVTLYVFDESDRLVMQREVANEGSYRPLSSYGFSMHITPDQLPAGRYRLVAVAQQKGYQATLHTEGAKYRRSEMKQGSLREELRITLDRRPADEDGVCDVDNTCALDTLWVGSTLNPDRRAEVLGEEWVVVREQVPAYSTVYLVRDTKHIHVALRQLEEPAMISHKDFEVTITSANGTVGHDNTVAAGDALLRYSPYNARTLKSEGGDYTVAQYDLNCSRLMDYAGSQDGKNAVLRIYNKSLEQDVLAANLPAWLAEARITPEYSYGVQEYLDRQYDYRLEVILKGMTWFEAYLYVQIGQLSWYHRIQNVDL